MKKIKEKIENARPILKSIWYHLLIVATTFILADISTRIWDYTFFITNILSKIKKRFILKGFEHCSFPFSFS